MIKRGGISTNTKVGLAVLLITLIVLIWLCLDLCAKIS